VCEVVAGKAWILAELLKKMRPKVSFSEKLLRALNWNGRFVEEFFEKLLYFEEILRISSKRMIFEEILRISSKRMIFEECWPKGQHSSRNIFISKNVGLKPNILGRCIFDLFSKNSSNSSRKNDIRERRAKLFFLEKYTSLKCRAKALHFKENIKLPEIRAKALISGKMYNFRRRAKALLRN
jgi:hypothetical protein